MAEEWPPTGLIAELGIDQNANIEDELDQNILESLPDGSEILSITPAGTSAWVQTVRIDTKQKDGDRKAYFKKTQGGSVGKRMMLGTWESENAMFTYIPEHVPKPIAYGPCKSDPDKYYYLAEFHDMIDKVPDPVDFVEIIVKLHKESMGNSPEGKFGFDVPTHLANVPNNNAWQETWEAWFTGAMRYMFDIEALSHGKNEEFEALKEQLFSKVIPRLLRPLETGGRKVVPCLIHSDLWPGNCMPDINTGKIMIFDSCAFWGHNEADLGSWRAGRYHMGLPFVQAYLKEIEESEPKDDWDDRNALYALRYELLVSAVFPNTEQFRNQAMNEMKRLTEKYPNGFEDFQEPEAHNHELKVNGHGSKTNDLESKMDGHELMINELQG